MCALGKIMAFTTQGQSLGFLSLYGGPPLSITRFSSILDFVDFDSQELFCFFFVFFFIGQARVA
jgi:hypothetical protein